MRMILREQAGDGGSNGGAAGDGKAPAGDPKPAGDDGKAGDKGGSSEPPAGYVSAESLRAVTQERDRLKRAADEAERKRMADAGQHEELAKTERSAREAAEERATRVARRAAFVSSAAGKVQDADAAFTLAQAAGLLEFDVDDDGRAKDQKAVDAAVAEVLKRHPFLAAKAGTGGRDFGDGDRSGRGGDAQIDLEAMTPTQLMAAGIARGEGRRAARTGG